MKILTIRLSLSLNILLFFLAGISHSNGQNTTIQQDPKFEQLLNEKRKINSSITINDRYKIQIFYGDSESAKLNLMEFKKEFKNHDATIIFSTPQYKVWVGNFKSRIEAEKNILEIKRKYPKAFLIKPNR